MEWFFSFQMHYAVGETINLLHLKKFSVSCKVLLNVGDENHFSGEEFLETVTMWLNTCTKVFVFALS